MCLLLTGSLKTFGRMEGTRMEFTPPSFTLIWDKMMICHEFCPSGVFTLRHRLERVWGEVLFTFFAWGRNWVLKLSQKSSETSVVVKIKWKKDLNTLRSHPQNSVTHSFDLHAKIWSFVKFAVMIIQMWYLSGSYNYYHCWHHGKYWQW